MRTSLLEALTSRGKGISCKFCMASISIPVLNECTTLCTLDGNAWEWRKAISDGLHVSWASWPVNLKYFASKFASSSLNLFWNADTCIGWTSLVFFPRGTNCGIDSLRNWTSGLKICGIYNIQTNKLKKVMVSMKLVRKSVDMAYHPRTGMKWKAIHSPISHVFDNCLAACLLLQVTF